jgi:hypothetical protein
VWDHNLRYDFNTIETSNGTYFFWNQWWSITLNTR